MSTALYDLASVNPQAAFGLADQRAATQDAERQADQAFRVVVCDIDGYPLGEIGDYISCVTTHKRNNVAGVTIVLKGNDLWVPYAMACQYTTIPIIVEHNGMRWSGKIDTCSDDSVDGKNTVTLQCVSDWNWFNHIMVFPNFLLPIQAQAPKEAVFIGPAITNIKQMIAEQVIRQSGIIGGALQFVNNITNPAAWLGSLLDIDKLAIPIAVVPTDPLTDTSKYTAITCRMTAVAAAVEQTLKDCGLILSAVLWQPGDPMPPGLTLTRPTIVVDVKDKSTVNGITGTALDGLIGEGVDLIDTILGEILASLAGADISDGGSTDSTNPYRLGVIGNLLGIHATPPWVVYEDGPRSGIRESHVTAHHPLAYRVIGGGKSPQWVNKGIDLAFEYALSALLAAVGASGISNTLLDGVFDDMFLAFQQVEDLARRRRLGRFGYPEMFAQTGSAAYTLDMWIALESALWDSRGYFSYQLVVQDRYPYSFGGDFFGQQAGDFGIGDPVSWVYKDVIYTDYCTEAVITDDRTHRVDCRITIGDGQAQESPWTKLTRKYQNISNVVKAAALASN